MAIGPSRRHSAEQLGGEVTGAVQRVAVAVKTAYGCNGVSTRQHNEPAGGQDVWHLHHVFPPMGR